MLRPITAAALLLTLLPTISSAQTVRFLTNVGDFFMELNPDDNADLAGHVDNLLTYVGTGSYHGIVLNRADTGFVLQLGGFTSDSLSPPAVLDRLERFDPVDVSGVNLNNVRSNTLGEVSLALSEGNANSGTSEFFVNLSDNSLLDGQSFIPFATIDDMSTIDRIMGLDQVDLSTLNGDAAGGLTFGDIPVTSEGDFVILESVMVVDEAFLDFVGPVRRVAGIEINGQLINTLAAPAETEQIVEQFIAPPTGSLLAGGSLVSGVSTPEPSSLLLLLSGTLLGRHRRRER